MDFETLFIQYKEEFTKENEEFGRKKAYKTILNKIKHLFFSIGIERKVAKKEEKNLKNRLIIEQILKNVTPEATVAINREILTEMNKEYLFGLYANITLALNEIITLSYKNHSSIANLSLLEALIKITTDCYLKDKEEFEITEKNLKEEMDNNQVPILKHIGTYHELKSFITQILCQNEELNFKEFQNKLLKTI